MKTQLEFMENSRELVESSETFLRKTGFLEGNTLTPRGVLASEVHEANPLVLTLTVERGVLEGLSQDEIVMAMAAFLEPPSGEDEPLEDALKLPNATATALAHIQTIVMDLVCKEERQSPPGYWELHTFWIPHTRDWLDGNVVQGVQEGAFVRAMLKLSSILDELTTLLTLKQKVDLLDTLQNVKQRILRDQVRPESL